MLVVDGGKGRGEVVPDSVDVLLVELLSTHMRLGELSAKVSKI